LLKTRLRWWDYGTRAADAQQGTAEAHQGVVEVPQEPTPAGTAPGTAAGTAPPVAPVPAKLIFQGTASQPQSAVALLFDLEGFSQFFSQPDVQDYVPKYLNRIFDCISVCIDGGTAYWKGRESRIPLPGLAKPAHVKFLGDGALYLWNTGEEQGCLDETTKIFLLNRLWNLQSNFGVVLKAARDDVPVADVPRRIRFGFAQGTVYRLGYAGDGGESEYIGYCINLASRLQRYCRELGFIASARLGLPQDVLDQNGYIKVVAKKLAGFPREVVVVDKDELKSLPTETRRDLFEDIVEGAGK
jgi:class 3 adenylate cyclase